MIPTSTTDAAARPSAFAPGRAFLSFGVWPCIVTRAHALRTVLRLACCCVAFGLFMIGLRVPVALLVLAVGVGWNRIRGVAASGWSHGTARVSSVGDLIRSNMLGEDGLILGTTGIMSRPSFWEGLFALWSARTSAVLACHLFLSSLGRKLCVDDRMIRLSHFTHLLTCAPTGRGKGEVYLFLICFPILIAVSSPTRRANCICLRRGYRHQKLDTGLSGLTLSGVCGPESGVRPIQSIGLH